MKRSIWVGASALAMVVACGNASLPPEYVDLSDTWTFDSHDWQQSSSDKGPAPRWGAVFVYDPAADQILLFGDGNIDVDETWTWNGHWTLRHPSHSPSARLGAVAVYDPVRRNVVLFGGNAGRGQIADIWTWDGNDWHQVSANDAATAGPFTGYESAAFDPVSRQVILITPCGNQSGGCSGDTRAWDGTRWTRYQTGPDVPPWPALYPSSGVAGIPSIYTDTKHGHVVMLGGDSPLVWDGSRWYAASGNSRWPGTAGGALAYDDQTGTSISFGAENCLSLRPGAGAAISSDATWAWDGVAWQQLETSTRPPARSSTYLAYDSMTQSMVMFGGSVQKACGIANLP